MNRSTGKHWYLVIIGWAFLIFLFGFITVATILHVTQ